MLPVPLIGKHFLHQALAPHFHTIPPKFLDHFLDQQVGPPPEGIDSLSHEVGKHDPISYGRILEGGSVCISDRFQQQTLHIVASWEMLLEQVPDRTTVGGKEIHVAHMLEKILHPILGDLELVLQQPSKVPSIESCPQVELWIHKTNVL